MQREKTNNPLINVGILSTAYFPPVEYFAVLASSGKALIERCETFQKQSYRTRCHIYSANGLLALTIPVKREESKEFKNTHKLLIDKIQIDYSKQWVLQHKRAIEAAYMTTPFFEYYKDDIFAILDSGEPYLFNLNMRIIELLNEFIGITTPIEFTEDWNSDYSTIEFTDLRNAIHPKSKESDMLDKLQIKKPYYQVFSNKQGFISNLSILDLLCNEGPNSISFLRRR